ncbi:MAG: outer membrane beta-barrel protein, partial [Saprospiraceae bacterium]|nr:outer membrane beta-barrel protein [Saprospiraceae bacterium]
MMVRNLTLALLFIVACTSLQAQDATTYRSLSPSDQWELGVDLGTPMIVGDIDAKFPGFGGGLHVRKSLGSVFSFRLGALYASMKNENERPDLATSETSWFSGSGQVVATVNNLLFNKPVRKVNFNVFGGLGFANFNTDGENIVVDGDKVTAEGTAMTYEVGAGLAFRVSPKFNVGVEYTFT